MSTRRMTTVQRMQNGKRGRDTRCVSTRYTIKSPGFPIMPTATVRLLAKMWERKKKKEESGNRLHFPCFLCSLHLCRRFWKLAHIHTQTPSHITYLAKLSDRVGWKKLFCCWTTTTTSSSAHCKHREKRKEKKKNWEQERMVMVREWTSPVLLLKWSERKKVHEKET